ncbi:serine protease [Streptomyces bauhiniae]|uniref:Serine protease n=1 Tax=Streptomyces bauhiniae TaxID=2340725 RepID=A0A4Z1CU31_9ACTN|nr:trypsin-like peptidase domain-containing protein [Streptomyces bauhiniae]TGN72171.1 serine protease [Streptomyces bauhiniae]
MAGEGPRTGSGGVGDFADALVQIRDLSGRLRGVGFLADHHGTLLTSHEAVDGLDRLLLRAADDRTRVVDAEAVVPLPRHGLALVRTENLGVAPLPLTVRDRIEAGTYVRIIAGGRREARVLTAAPAAYPAGGRSRVLDDALELALGTAARDALRPGGGTTGGPVLDARTGAVLGVLGASLRAAGRDSGFAAPVRPGGETDPALTALLARNAATVPAYGTDLNLAGVLQLCAASVSQDGPPGTLTGLTGIVERASVARELADFMAGPHPVLALTGDPGSGRTTELAALAARRRRGDAPAPTLWLRGADLRGTDDSVADAVRRALERAAPMAAASGPARTADLGDLDPEPLAALAAREGRPLLICLDAPEEMPPALLPEWATGTAEWLRATGARLVLACGEEFWETAAEQFPARLRLTALTRQEARTARSRYGVPDGALTDADARHPLALRLLSEVRAALPAHAPVRAPDRHGVPDADARHPLALRLRSELPADAPVRPHVVPDGALTDADTRPTLTPRLLSVLPADPPPRPLDRHDVFAAHLDLTCLRVAERIAAANGLDDSAVRRLATRVAGQVHEAARRALGHGLGLLDRESFAAVFPHGRAPARLGGGTGWASAVLDEGLLVRSGGGYRFAHEEFADWVQGTHLDLDEALHVLVHRPRAERPAGVMPVPHHRIGPVVQALLLLGRRRGPRQLAFRLRELADALDLDPGSWWAARLLSRTLLRAPDALPYREELRFLADRLVAWRRAGQAVPGEFGPTFWTALALPDAERFALLRRLVPADPAVAEGAGERYLDAAARLLAADPAAGQPYLTRWFEDERPLPATPHATVATAAQALLHTHRYGALDHLTEALIDSGHRRAVELLAVLAEDEPSAACRAVDRWARDEDPGRRATALVLARRTAPHTGTSADHTLLRRAAHALLARPADRALHGGALALLTVDPVSRDQHLPRALRHFTAGDRGLPPSALLPALATHPDTVLDAFRARLRAAPDPAVTLRALADVTDPALARRIAALVRETVAPRAEAAPCVAEYVDRRLGLGPTARTELLPLLTGLLGKGFEAPRAALAAVLVAPGTPATTPLRRELLDLLLAHERDPDVLVAVLRAAATLLDGDGADPVVAEARGLVHRTARLLGRTAGGGEHRLTGLVRELPGFGARLARWLAEAPEEWAAVVGPGVRRAIEERAGTPVPA